MKEFKYPRNIKPIYRGSNTIEINEEKQVIVAGETKFSDVWGRFLNILYLLPEKDITQELVDTAYKEYIENPSVFPKLFNICIAGDFLNEEEYKVDDIDHSDDVLDLGVLNSRNVKVIGKVNRKGKYKKTCWGLDKNYTARTYEGTLD